MRNRIMFFRKFAKGDGKLQRRIVRMLVVQKEFCSMDNDIEIDSIFLRSLLINMIDHRNICIIIIRKSSFTYANVQSTSMACYS